MPTRRAVLASVGAVATAGCSAAYLGGARPAITADCPTTQDLDVEWPRNLNPQRVTGFVESYEQAYYRDTVLSYEPETRLDALELNGRTGTAAVTGGYRVKFAGRAEISRPDLEIAVSLAFPPDGADVVSADSIDDGTIRATLDRAITQCNGEGSFTVTRSADGAAAIDRYIAMVSALSEDVAPDSTWTETVALFIDYRGSPIKLTLSTLENRVDDAWTVRYYVNENVVVRDGNLLECREPPE